MDFCVRAFVCVAVTSTCSGLLAGGGVVGEGRGEGLFNQIASRSLICPADGFCFVTFFFVNLIQSS